MIFSLQMIDLSVCDVTIPSSSETVHGAVPGTRAVETRQSAHGATAVAAHRRPGKRTAHRSRMPRLPSRRQPSAGGRMCQMQMPVSHTIGVSQNRAWMRQTDFVLPVFLMHVKQYLGYSTEPKIAVEYGEACMIDWKYSLFVW